jgi:hypothetical protein
MQISAKTKKEPAVAYTIIAEFKIHRLMGDRFTADTASEALDRVQHIRSRGFLVKITGPDGKPVSENNLEAEAAAIRSLTAGLGALTAGLGASLDAFAAVNKRSAEPPPKGLDLDDPAQRLRFQDGEL